MKISKKQLQEMVKKQVQEQPDFEDDLYDAEFIDDVEVTGFDLEEEFQDLVMKYDRGMDDPDDKERAEDVMNRIFDLEPAMYDDFKKQYEMRWGSDEDSEMHEAHQAKKTEHGGAKKGKGAYYGKKKDAKKQSSKLRRKQGKEESGINEIFDELQEQGTVSDPVQELISGLKQEVAQLVKRDTGQELSKEAVRDDLDIAITNGVTRALTIGHDEGYEEGREEQIMKGLAN